MQLVDSIFDYLNGLDESIHRPFLANWPSKPFKTRTVFPNTLPVVSYLAGIHVNGDERAKEVVSALRSCADDLCWGQTYSAQDFGTKFLDKYGWTELIGLRGHVASENIACGFLLLGPHVEYPNHSHEAEEVYVPFSSHSPWKHAGSDWKLKQRGAPIYHEPWLVHGMRTGPQPLLALYIWQGGDLAQKSRVE